MDFNRFGWVCLSQEHRQLIRFWRGFGNCCCLGNIFMIFQSYSLLQPKSLSQFTMTFLRYVLTKTIYSSLGFGEDLTAAFAMATVSKFLSLNFQSKPVHGFLQIVWVCLPQEHLQLIRFCLGCGHCFCHGKTIFKSYSLCVFFSPKALHRL